MPLAPGGTMNGELLLAASLGLFVGCSAKSSTTLTHPNPAMLDSATVEKERRACRQEALQFPEWSSGGEIEAVAGLCMRGRGYAEVNKDGVPVGYVETDVRGEPVESDGDFRDAAVIWFKPGATIESYRLAWKRCYENAETVMMLYPSTTSNDSKRPIGFKEIWIARCMKQDAGWTCLGPGCIRSKGF